MIQFEAVSYRYDPSGPDVVSGLSLELPAGSFLGVIGPNGAGKSTVLRLLTGLFAPRTGRVLLDGTDVRRLPPRERARRIAAVPQEEPLEFPFTALEVVLLGRAARLGAFGFERAADLDAAHTAMQQTGVLALAGRPFHALSGGERKRVVLARALSQETDVLVLDEPAAALDVHHQIAIFDLLAERNRKGATVVVVVHDLNLAAAYCRRLLLLAAPAPGLAPTGEEGSPETILTAERVRRAFGVEVYVGENPLTGRRLLVPVSSSGRRPEPP